MKENKVLLKTLLVFITYLFYTKIISFILGILNVNNNIVVSLIADLIYFFSVIYIYHNSIKQGYENFKNNYNLKNKIVLVIKWVILLYCITILGGILTEMAIGPISEDDNTTAIYSLFNVSTIYTIFKTMLFAVIAEELVFKNSIREIVNNDILFIILSSFIYAFMNVAYSNFNLVTVADFTQSFISAAILSILYIKSSDNIFIVMLVKFTYNLIPLTIMILGIGD